MFDSRLALAAALVVVACTRGNPATTTAVATPGPSDSRAPTTSSTPSAVPPTDVTASLDPSLSDAGVIGQITLSNDTFGSRDGTYTVVGVAAEGSDCSQSFDGTEFTAVAWHDDAPNGQIFQFGVTVTASAVPAEGTTGGTSGRVSFDFVSESGFGTLYIADASKQDGQVTIDTTRQAGELRFDFQGSTKAGVQFTGTMICSESGL